MIKTEAASPAASKEEEDEEDEVKIFMVWYYICAAASQNQTHFEFVFNFQPFPGGGRSSQFFSHPDGLAAKAKCQSRHGWGEYRFII